MKKSSGESYRVAIPKTTSGNGIAEAISEELEALGHHPSYFHLDEPLPAQTEVVFLFGPFGKFVQVLEPYAWLPRSARPTFVFWNTEGLPDLRLPWLLTGPASKLRSWLGRWDHSEDRRLRRLAGTRLFQMFEPRFLRFRYLGDYLYAHRLGLMDVFADISAVYAGYFRQRGIPAHVAPFGSFGEWYQDLELERDIDVVWMGKRATRRRSEALDRVRVELRQQGIEIHMVDNVENPFVFDNERTRLLNRAKITLNLLRTWYDENSLRICMAAPNRSLVVSEPLLPHVPEYQAGVHYVSAPIEELAATIRFFLEHADERERIVENAYELLTNRLTWFNSMQTIMEEVQRVRHQSGIQTAQPPAASLVGASSSKR